MKPQPYEGQLRVWFVPAIADKSAPTAAEMTAGTELTSSLTADGIRPNHTENTVATDMLTGFIKQSIGTEGVTFSLQLVKDFDGTDEPYDLFDERGKDGFLVINAENAGETAGDVNEVYPAQFGRRKRVQSGANAHQMYSVMVTCDDDFDDDAVVAA